MIRMFVLPLNPSQQTDLALKVPIKAGHEFVVSTEDKYKECCDDKVMYVDYVRGFLP
jgi:Pyruvate kinase, barrel domain